MVVYQSEGHKIWDWTYKMEEIKLFHWSIENTADIFCPSTSCGLAIRVNAWSCTCVDQHIEKVGQRYKVKGIGAI